MRSSPELVWCGRALSSSGEIEPSRGQDEQDDITALVVRLPIESVSAAEAAPPAATTATARQGAAAAPGTHAHSAAQAGDGTAVSSPLIAVSSPLIAVSSPLNSKAGAALLLMPHAACDEERDTASKMSTDDVEFSFTGSKGSKLSKDEVK